jgi:SAM-dependent methyltransferase
MLEEARAVLGDRAGYRVVDAREIPYEDESFDIVVANHMLYHVPDAFRPQAIAEMARVLRPQGRLVAATNGTDHMAELRDLVESDAEWTRSMGRFGLESGATQLPGAFDGVEVELFDDHLEVTDADAVLAYVASTATAREITAEHRDRIRAHVQGVIDRNGFSYISKSQGIFRAWHPCPTGA